jgi:hypothetical protein
MATEPSRENVLGTNSLFQVINGKPYVCLSIEDWRTLLNDPNIPDEPTPEQCLVSINVLAAKFLTEERRDGDPLNGISGTPNQMVAFGEPEPSYTTRDGKNVQRISITMSLDKVDETATIITPSKY